MTHPIAAAVLAATLGTAVAAHADDRQLVALPAPMQEHMLGNMRDHLAALDDILAALATGRVSQAAEVAEARLGMSSLGLHGASHMAPLMPQPMKDAGTAMHRAASRFALAAQAADIEQTYAAQQAVFAALHEVTAACNACHTGYRIR